MEKKSSSSIPKKRPRLAPAAPGESQAPVASAAGASAGSVRVLARGLTILRVFSPKNDWLSNHEIAAAADLPRPTVSRLTANLAEMG